MFLNNSELHSDRLSLKKVVLFKKRMNIYSADGLIMDVKYTDILFEYIKDTTSVILEIQTNSCILKQLKWIPSYYYMLSEVIMIHMK